MDQRKFREVTGRFATGVTVVTTRLGEEVHGMTVNSLCSVSVDPPLILFCGGPTSRTAQRIPQSGIFAVSMLAADQREISQRFAVLETEAGDRFLALHTFRASTGCPILEGCLAYMDCTLWSVTEAGDHSIFIGHVQAMELHRETQPLIFFASQYRHLGAW